MATPATAPPSSPLSLELLSPVAVAGGLLVSSEGKLAVLLGSSGGTAVVLGSPGGKLVVLRGSSWGELAVLVEEVTAILSAVL